jgi:N-acetylglucosamine-6-sulfatase
VIRVARTTRALRPRGASGGAAVLLMWLALLPGCGEAPEGGPGRTEEAVSSRPAPDHARPNIVFILADDLAPGTLGFEGNAVIRTPRLDRLAREGVYFSRAYVPIPQCAPSRAAILTGLYPHQNGVVSNVETQLKPGLVTFGEVFKRAGYACGLIGKWHLGHEDRPQRGFVDRWVSFPLPGNYYDPELYVDGESVRGDGYMTNILTDYAIEFIDQHAEAPFLLWLAYKAPHWPTLGPPDTRFRYDPDAIQLPEKSMADDLSTKPAAQRDGDPHRWFQERGVDWLRERIALYYAMISSMDENVGRLVDHLRSLGLDRRTLVIFMSDNGVLMGEHRMINKGPLLYEPLVRTPLIMWWPGRIQARTRVQSLVSSLDIFPMMCASAGIAVPEGLAGRSLWPLIEHRDSSLRDGLFFEFTQKKSAEEPVALRGLVTERYKYVRYLERGEELYDLNQDPHECINLIGDASRGELADALRAKLEQWRRETGDLP